eukprot:c10564_g1_i1.p2 GENE.c10564_g1_i1~~c10564_g1_i1.p2  ORF type:complete len:196 (-),score=58.75 c10564_g1_i1:246-833(-)
MGGSNELGSWGYVDAVAEMEHQLSAMPQAPAFSQVFFACGSGGTGAGLGLGIHHSPHPAFAHALPHAVAVCDTEDEFYDCIQKLFEGMGDNSKTREVMKVTLGKGAGYGVASRDELAFLAAIAGQTGVLLDPVYTGKSMYAAHMLATRNPELFEDKDMLFVHTGGLFGLYDKEDQLLEFLPQMQVQRFPLELIHT